MAVWSSSGAHEFSAGLSGGVCESVRRNGKSCIGSIVSRPGKSSELVEGVKGPLGCGEMLGGGGMFK